jgi:hypothetical protein
MPKAIKRTFGVDYSQKEASQEVSAQSNHWIEYAAEWYITFNQQKPPRASYLWRKLQKLKEKGFQKDPYFAKLQTVYSEQSMVAYDIGTRYAHARNWYKSFVAFEIYHELLQKDAIHGPHRQDDYHLQHLAEAVFECNHKGNFLCNMKDEFALVAQEIEVELEKRIEKQGQQAFKSEVKHQEEMKKEHLVEGLEGVEGLEVQGVVDWLDQFQTKYHVTPTLTKSPSDSVECFEGLGSFNCKE